MNKQSVKEVVRAGHSHWKIEKSLPQHLGETFNTLKNQGYHFMHNFGHGHQHLSTVFCILMMLVFTIDQIAQAADKYFKGAGENEGLKSLYRKKYVNTLILWLLKTWKPFIRLSVKKLKI